MAMDFGGALHCVVGGGSVYRHGWPNGHYMKLQKPDDHSKMTSPYLYVQSGEMDGGTCYPWFPTNEDMLTQDWVKVEG
jgi:hypothetical protein